MQFQQYKNFKNQGAVILSNLDSALVTKMVVHNVDNNIERVEIGHINGCVFSCEYINEPIDNTYTIKSLPNVPLNNCMIKVCYGYHDIPKCMYLEIETEKILPFDELFNLDEGIYPKYAITMYRNWNKCISFKTTVQQRCKSVNELFVVCDGFIGTFYNIRCNVEPESFCYMKYYPDQQEMLRKREPGIIEPLTYHKEGDWYYIDNIPEGHTFNSRKGIIFKEKSENNIIVADQSAVGKVYLNMGEISPLCVDYL